MMRAEDLIALDPARLAAMGTEDLLVAHRILLDAAWAHLDRGCGPDAAACLARHDAIVAIILSRSP